MLITKTPINFVGSTDSDAFASNLIFGVQTPASFVATSLVLLYCETLAGTYIPVCNEAGAAIGITGIDATNAKFYDMSNNFPIGIDRVNNLISGYIKFRANTSITKTINVYTGDN